MATATLKNQLTETANPIAKIVRIWLMIGVILVFVQVVIGGITRLTDSGLSITEWEVIKGTLPPLNDAQWIEAFDKYKIHAKKQFESLHADMTMPEFKRIYFWEYFHRLWARSMGFIFLFPFLYFLWQRMLPGWLIRRLGVVIALAMLAATFGWIMVASGLNEDTRTWVSAYKLVGHLSIATVLFGYLFWTWLRAAYPQPSDAQITGLKRLSVLVTGLILVQIVFGGLMAGMRAGLIHPYFPFFVEGERLLGAFQNTTSGDLVNYEGSIHIKAWVQMIHRTTAYLLLGLIIYFFVKAAKYTISQRLNTGRYLLISMLVIQFILGILTIINCFGKVPVVYGALHQAGALVLLAIALFINYQLKPRNVYN